MISTRRSRLLVPWLVVLIMGVSFNVYGQGQAGTDNKGLTQVTWTMVGVIGLGIGVLAGWSIFSTVGTVKGTGVMEKRAQLLDIYLETSPSAALEATAWRSSGVETIAHLCGAQTPLERERVGWDVRRQRAALLTLMDQPSGAERGHRLWTLWCQGVGQLSLLQTEGAWTR